MIHGYFDRETLKSFYRVSDIRTASELSYALALIECTPHPDLQIAQFENGEFVGVTVVREIDPDPEILSIDDLADADTAVFPVENFESVTAEYDGVTKQKLIYKSARDF